MSEKPESRVAPPVKPLPEAPQTHRQVFQRPALRRLGALPRVTAAFGGSFTP